MARKQKKYHFIYKTTNLLSGKYYIGMHSTDNIDDGYLGSGNRLRLAIRKHGKENFSREILEFCNSREILRNRESEVVTLEEVAKVECMNLAVGGKGGTDSGGGKAFAKRLIEDEVFSKHHSEITSKRMKKTHKTGKLKYNNFKDKVHSEETKKKMSESSKGSGTGKTNSQFGTCWITKDDKNKKIKKEDLEIYTKDGWVKGRYIK